MENGCVCLTGLALGLTLFKLLGVVSWSWFLVTLPVTLPILLCAAVAAIVFGIVAAIFFVGLVVGAAGPTWFPGGE
jgi:hypothetical protein